MSRSKLNEEAQARWGPKFDKDSEFNLSGTPTHMHWFGHDFKMSSAR